jgi:ASC-1-like (ASCH) protein
MNHISHLHPNEFSQISSGTKTIESRLYDEKRQKIHIGDTLTYVNRGDYKTSLETIVLALHRHHSFDELFSSLPYSKLGNLTHQELIAQVRQFYTPEDERIHGVVGVEFIIKK